MQFKIALLTVVVFGSVPLCAMKMEPYKKTDKKSDDYSSLQNTLFAVQAMHTRGEIPYDVAANIVYTSCLVRMDTLYKKFDPFFHFNDDNYAKKLSAHNEYLKLHILLALKLGNNFNNVEIKQYQETALKHINQTCRKFDIVEPRHLLFFTEKQDEILFSLINRPNCFFQNKNFCHIVLTAEERKNYRMLPAELRALLNKYPKSYTP